jgi:hypothetical protein
LITHKLNSSRDRYIEFLEKFQGRTIDLNMEIRRFKASDGKGIGCGTKAWEIAGVAKKVARKRYFIDPYNYEEVVQNAELILQKRLELYGRNAQPELVRPVITEEEAIELLKSKGYKILKPNTQYTEI